MGHTNQSITAIEDNSALIQRKGNLSGLPFLIYAGTVEAGAAGFEPADVGSKGRCLTTWRRPKRQDWLPDIIVTGAEYTHNKRNSQPLTPDNA
jgi:hypothetical protein